MAHLQAIKRFILDEFLPDLTCDELDLDYDLLDGGVIDSLGLLKLVTWVEERFELSLDGTVRTDDFRSVTAISAFVEQAR